MIADSSYLGEIVSIYVVYLAAAMTPGPNLLVIAGTALGTSRGYAVATALGVSTGTAVYAAVTMLGLSALLAELSFLSTLVRVCGGAYLIYLGVRALQRARWRMRGARAVDALATAPLRTGQSLAAAYVTGLLVNLSNAKAIVFYLSLMSLVVTPVTPVSVKVVGGLGMVALSVAWYATVAVALSASRVRAAHRHAAGWIDAALGVSMLAVGTRLLLAPGE